MKQVPMVLAVSLLGATLASSAGCGSDPLPVGSACDMDADCETTAACDRTDVCTAKTDLISSRITWTVKGQLPNSAVCSEISSLVFQFSNATGDRSFTISGVNCLAPQLEVDKVPASIIRLKVTATRASGTTTAEAVIEVDGDASVNIP